MTYKVFTSGSGTWTVPSGVSSVKVTLIGAGGGGGGSAKYSSQTTWEGGGGGGGACTQFTISGLSSGTSYSYSVGSGGAGGEGQTTNNIAGTTGEIGSAGGATSFGSYYVNGGSGGKGGFAALLSGSNGQGGAGGTGGSSPSTIYDGGKGGNGGYGGYGYGAGGSVSNAGGGGGGLGDSTIYNYTKGAGYTPYTNTPASDAASEGGKIGHYGTGGGGDAGHSGSLYGVGGQGGNGLIILEYTQTTVYTNLAINITNGTGTYDGSTSSSITMLVPIGGTYRKSGTSLYIYYNGSTYATITNIVASSSAYDKETWSSTSGTFASGGTTITITFSEATYTGTVYLGTYYKQFQIRSPSDYAGTYTSNVSIQYKKGAYLDVDWTGNTIDTTVSTYEKYTTVYSGTNYEDLIYSDGTEVYSGDGKTLPGQNCTIKPYPNTASESSKTYYYRAVVSFNANNGSGAPSQVTSDWQTSSDSIYVSWSGTPTRSGYTFLGWAKSSSATTPDYYGTSGYFSKGSVTLYAVWEQTPNNWYSVLGYNANNGSGAPSNDSSYISQVAQPSARTVMVSYTEPTRDGYKFLGWSTSSTATSSSYSAGSTLTVAYQKDNSNPSITLYAVWEKVPYYYSTLYYNANNGSGAPDTDTVRTVSDTLPSARTVTISSTVPMRTGYTFLGWSTSSTATTASYVGGGTISVAYSSSSTAGTTLYAVWKINTYQITISADPSEGGSVEGSQSGTYEYGATISLQTVPADNWMFTGWNDSYPQAFRAFTVKADGEYVVYFRRKVYTVRLYANDGTATKTDQSMQCGVLTPLMSNPYKRSTYSFMGWSTTAEGSVEYTNEESVSLSTTDGEIVSLYAVWDHVEPADPGVIQFKRWDGSEGERLTYSDIARIESAVNVLLSCVELDEATYHSTPTRASALDYRDMSIIEAKTSAMAAMMDIAVSTFTGWYAGYRLTYVDMERIESNLYAVYISFGGTTPRIDA